MKNKIVKFRPSESLTVKSNKLSLDNLLKNWQICIAIEIIEQWKSYNQVKLDLINTLDILDLTKNDNFKTLFKQVKFKIKNAKKLNISIEKIEEYRMKLEKYFFNEIEQQIPKENYILKSKTIEAFNELIFFDSQKASPENLLKLFSNLSAQLCLQKINFEQQKTQYLRQENSAWRAYFKLIDNLDDCAINSLEYNAITESIWKAIIIGFESKLNLEKYIAYSHIVQNLIQLCQDHHDSANRSIKLLNRIQRSLKNQISDAIVFSPILDQLVRMDILTQKNLIEIWIGHSLNFWGDTSISWQQIEAKLLENIEPIVMELYEEGKLS